MATHSDKGHANNVASLEKVLSVITSFGTVYNPSKSTLKLPALQALASSAKASLITVNTCDAGLKSAAAARKTSFSLLDGIVTRALNALIASDTNQQVIENGKSIVRKLRGKRASSKLSEEELATLKAEGKSTTQISSSQKTFDSRIENFDRFIKLLSGCGTYIPNEADLKITGLTATYTNLKTTNAAVISAETALKNARIARNTIIYKPKTGLVDVGLDSKVYVKSLFGATSPQYKQISAIPFKTLNV